MSMTMQVKHEDWLSGEYCDSDITSKLYDTRRIFNEGLKVRYIESARLHYDNNRAKYFFKNLRSG